MAKHTSKKKSEKKTSSDKPIDITAAIAPIALIGSTFLARKAAEALYKAATGNPPPKASDPEAKATSVLTWTLVAAGAVALTEMAVSRVLAKKK